MNQPVVRSRIVSVDMLRGLIMIVMALDHVRDYFSNAPVDPTDAAHTWTMLYLTRWVTHLCAPVFMLLAGTGAHFQLQRGKTRGQLSRFLLSRGLWLVFLELTYFHFAWQFSFGTSLAIIIWALGWCMVALAALIWLPTWLIAVIGGAMVALHNFFDRVRVPQHIWHGFWKVLHNPGVVTWHNKPVLFVFYPLIPWIGVMALGYCFGAFISADARVRERRVFTLSVAMLAAFAVLRGINHYGDTFPWTHQATLLRTAFAFFNVRKYPPSLDYLLVTLGIALLLWVLFDWMVEHGAARPVQNVLNVYGRVPFFYYMLHIPLIHILALTGTAIMGLNWHWYMQPLPQGGIFSGTPDGWGFGLPIVYVVWIAVVAALYPLCKWFAGVKARRKDWWLGYL